MTEEVIEGTINLIREETRVDDLKNASDADLAAAGVKPEELSAVRARIRLVLAMIEHVRAFKACERCGESTCNGTENPGGRPCGACPMCGGDQVTNPHAPDGRVCS